MTGTAGEESTVVWVMARSGMAGGSPGQKRPGDKSGHGRRTRCPGHIVPGNNSRRRPSDWHGNLTEIVLEGRQSDYEQADEQKACRCVSAFTLMTDWEEW